MLFKRCKQKNAYITLSSDSFVMALAEQDNDLGSIRYVKCNERYTESRTQVKDIALASSVLFPSTKTLNYVNSEEVEKANSLLK